MSQKNKLTINQKALEVNLDDKIYGSFAEIGAGQEVAANFFKAGGASGTVAKTMSAYDMSFSDAIYGPEESGRYVCESRLIKMIDKEYRLLIERLPERIDNTRFFAFANTVEALNFRRTNQGHGWLGLRFQTAPDRPPNDCILHMIMHDNDSLRQQQAIGAVGVNLTHGCFFTLKNDPEAFLQSLVDDLSPGRVEFDYFRVEGPDFEDFDNRLFSLKLVKNGLSNVTMFGPDGNVMQPADELYKKNILVLRGRFRPVTHINLDMLNTALDQFKAEAEVDESRLRVITELTLSNLKNSDDSDEINEKDFLDRVDILCSLGQIVMISNYHEYYKLVQYLSRFTRNKLIGIVLGIRNLGNIFDEKYYNNLQGGILSSFGMLFGPNVKLYVYPSIDKNEVLYNCDNFELPFHLFGLFRYLYDNEKLEDLEGVNTDILHITSDRVLAMIRAGEDGWEEMVPHEVVNQIKERKLFNYGENQLSS